MSRCIALLREPGAQERLLADDARRLRRMFGPPPMAEESVRPPTEPGALTAALTRMAGAPGGP